MPIPWRVIGISLLALGAFAAAWQFQGWRYGQQLAEQARFNAETLNQLTLSAATAQRVEQDKRLALAQRLATSEQSHYRALSDAQRDQDRLRDRLATADVRLSVLLDTSEIAPGCNVPPAAGAGRVDPATVRARLDPAHAQRIIAITAAGDRGLIALQACQAYVRALAPQHFE
ncbi:bacteriophage signal peptide protein [Pseudomonas fluorescens]|uniref:Bacteriophage signal peptide protein n=1 Tax=Pseudomonas fluorescens TaxID=294 RepID=A0A448DR83_PSEFL|nr:lysis system i-spanin subunit Rz [Pseudomonas fluorescens]VEF09313.1 bacteriophage signal peptide protein [Pseudomonas fluorescens]